MWRFLFKQFQFVKLKQSWSLVMAFSGQTLIVCTLSLGLGNKGFVFWGQEQRNVIILSQVFEVM